MRNCVRRLLEDRGIYVKEACDACGKIIGSDNRFTSNGRNGVWCSRECRNGKEAHAPATCWACGASLAGLRRGTRFCSDTCRIRENRKSQTTQISRDEQLKTQGLQTRVEVMAVPLCSALLKAAIAFLLFAESGLAQGIPHNLRPFLVQLDRQKQAPRFHFASIQRIAFLAQTSLPFSAILACSARLTKPRRPSRQTA